MFVCEIAQRVGKVARLQPSASEVPRSTAAHRSRSSWTSFAGVAAHPEEPRSVRSEMAGDDFELDADRAKALKQRVVDLAADPCPLGQHQRELMLNGAEAQPPIRTPRASARPIAPRAA